MNNIISNINPSTFTGSAILIGFLLVNELSTEEQVSVGNWLELVGMVLQTYSSQASTNQSVKNSTKKNISNCDMDTLKKAINTIKEKLEKM